MYCEHCGQKLDLRAEFCNHCGTHVSLSEKIVKTNHNAVEGEITNQQVIKKVFSKHAGSVFIVLAIIGILILVIRESNSPTNNINITGSSDESQILCKSSAEKAFEAFKNPANNNGVSVPEMIGSGINEQTETATTNYKFNYDKNSNLCFIEFIVSAKAQMNDASGIIQQDAKGIGVLLNDTVIHQILAAFGQISYPIGSKQIVNCYVHTQDHYDDIQQKTIGDLFNPTQCSSEADFDALVFERFGIQ